MSEMTNQQYAEYVKRKSPASPIWGDLLRAFLIGGAICALGQVITELWVLVGLEEAEAGTACSMSLVFLGALFTGLGVYDDAAKLGGAGTLVPITGFANANAGGDHGDDGAVFDLALIEGKLEGEYLVNLADVAVVLKVACGP